MDMRHTVAIAELRVGNFRHRMSYRKGTTDEFLLGQVFKECVYRLNGLARIAEISAFLQRKAEEGLRPLIIDAGANIGAVSVYLRGVLPNAYFVCIEPVPETFRLREQNMAGIAGRMLHAGLAGHAGELEVYDADHGKFDSYRTANAPDRAFYPADGDPSASTKVPAVTVRQILEQSPADTYPFIVKIDIEGAERDVFTGDTGWFHRFPLAIVEVHDWLMPRSGTAAPFLKVIAEAQRDFIIHGENIISMAYDLG